jgi:hypothetical protein
MEQKILGIAGKKQAGKNTLSNFLHGLQLQWNGIITNFAIDEEGDLIVEGLPTIIDGEEQLATVKLTVDQTNDFRFARWAADSMWPFIKNYSFAESLKEITIDLFECPRNLVYGSDEDKQTVMDHLLWENMSGVITDSEFWNYITPDGDPEGGLLYHEPGPMTIREFLQFFGSDIMRKMYEPVWVNRCIKDILTENSGVAVISDCRFNNEIDAVQENNGKIIGLTRNPFDDKHKSENSFDLEKCDAVIDNQDMNIREMCDEAVKILKDWGWIQTFVPKGDFFIAIKDLVQKRSSATMKINPAKEGKNI